ncbi:hypothetical protein PYX09_12115 [Xanthomonas oryzae pv. oryzae]|nr:hypothetical protein [Xanthomonas oryzae]MDI9070981.1 hypothetical protein [Xanthomonas oryzae pv. oryzae]MDI9079411.1 hypothetical protein [Xanthomonas oryzae pv. oryzae]MDI9102163.1 hypothetical protein [Xanthomonas oryzae pv. oryzae]MDI9910889.1 hypothetical protein [Xanthomonas oryzae pv. oryzae]UEG99351.1 hypothetical protein LLC55_12470 [Xanthomonas oryzae pv. oryzae]
MAAHGFDAAPFAGIFGNVGVPVVGEALRLLWAVGAAQNASFAGSDRPGNSGRTSAQQQHKRERVTEFQHVGILDK